MKVLSHVPVRAHERRVLREDPQAGQPGLFGEDPLQAQVRAIGEILKDNGMALAAKRNAEALQRARKMAVNFALSRTDRCVTSDDVLIPLERDGVAPGNWCGSIFKGHRWLQTGQMVLSRRPAAHARKISVWRLVDGAE